MKQPKKYYNLNLLLLSLISSMLLAACNNGSSNTTSTSPVNNSTLAAYKALLKYTPYSNMQSNSLRANNSTYQQSFTTPASLNLLAIRATAFSSESCAYNTQLGVVEMGDGSSGVDFPAGTYSSTNQSNNALYTRMVSAMPPGVPPESAIGIRFDYQYNTANNGPGWVSAGCMATGLANYENGTSGIACQGGSSTTACGFKASQTESLPTTFRQAIFVTTNLTDGNIGVYGNGDGGFVGANTFCMQDPNIPSQGAASNWKALLSTNNSTTSGVTYYDETYTNIIATATGGNLTGFSGTALSNEIGSFPAPIPTTTVWTGATPSMDSSYSGWSSYPNGASSNSCNNWTSNSASDSGVLGMPWTVQGQASAGSPSSDNYGYLIEGSVDCSQPKQLYCVQQNN